MAYPIVYGSPLSPFVRKVCVLMREKDLAFELIPGAPNTLGEEFHKRSPLGKMPVYQEGDKSLPDSSVICAYLEKVHPPSVLYPLEAYDFGRALWFEEYADTAMVESLVAHIFGERIVFPTFFGRPTNEQVVEKAINEELPEIFDYLESKIGTSTYLVTDRLTIADISVATPFVNLKHADHPGVDADRWPGLARYVEGILSRPSFAELFKQEVEMLAGMLDGVNKLMHV